MNILSERLKSLREEKNISRVQAANELKISRASLEYYEKGERTPDALTLRNIALFYNVSTDYLLGLSDIKTTNIDIKAVNEIIGLSESAIETLKKINDIAPSDIKALSYIISSFGFDEIVDKVERYLFLSHLRTNSENIQINEYIKLVQDNTKDYIENRPELEKIVLEFIVKKANMGISEIAALYLQEARDDLLYIVKGLVNKYKR